MIFNITFASSSILLSKLRLYIEKLKPATRLTLGVYVNLLNSKWTYSVKKTLTEKFIKQLTWRMKSLLVLVIPFALIGAMKWLIPHTLVCKITAIKTTLVTIYVRIRNLLIDLIIDYQIPVSKSSKRTVKKSRSTQSLERYWDISEEDSNEMKKRDYERLLLIKRYFILKKELEYAQAQEAIRSLNRIIRKDLDVYDMFPITPETAELASLKMWTIASQPLENRYVFDAQQAFRRCYYNPEWNLDFICREMNLSADLIEFLYLSENEQQRRIALQTATSSTNKQTDLFTDSIKTIRWLAKHTFTHNQNLTNTHLLTNTKKLFSSNGTNADLLKSNLWLSNNILNKTISTSELIDFKHIVFNQFNNTMKSQNFNATSLPNYLVRDADEKLKYYNTNFIWFLKTLYSMNTSNTYELNAAIRASKVPTDNALSINDILFLYYNIDKNITKFQNNLEECTKTNLIELDILLNNSNNLLLDTLTLQFLHELSNPITDNSHLFYHYSLNKYTTLSKKIANNSMNEEDLQGDISVLKEVFKSNNVYSLARVDLTSKEYAKNLYSYISLFIKR